jgi:hypothetical protein
MKITNLIRKSAPLILKLHCNKAQKSFIKKLKLKSQQL